MNNFRKGAVICSFNITELLSQAQIKRKQNKTITNSDVALQCWDGLQKLWSSRDKELFDSVEHNKQVAESERYIFRVFCYRAEAVSIIL